MTYHSGSFILMENSEKSYFIQTADTTALFYYPGTKPHKVNASIFQTQ